MNGAPARPHWLERLLAEPGAYDPFVVIGLLEQLRPEAKRIGGDGPSTEETLRLEHGRSLSFAAGDIASVDWGERPTVSLNIVGLTGTGSPLPTYLASEAALDDEHGQTKAAFFDLFHHRLHSLLYRAVRKYDWAQEWVGAGNDAWSLRLLALLGVDVYERAPLRWIRPVELLRIAPLLISPARTAVTIERALAELLADQLGSATVRIEQFEAAWVEIDEDHQIQLGARNSRLGHDAMLGDKCMDRAGKAKLVVGPLDQTGLRKFGSGGDAYFAVHELLDLLVADLVEWELELVLAQASKSAAILGSSRLSDDAWLASASEDDGESPDTRVRVPFDRSMSQHERGTLPCRR